MPLVMHSARKFRETSAGGNATFLVMWLSNAFVARIAVRILVARSFDGPNSHGKSTAVSLTRSPLSRQVVRGLGEWSEMLQCNHKPSQSVIHILKRHS